MLADKWEKKLYELADQGNSMVLAARQIYKHY